MLRKRDFQEQGNTCTDGIEVHLVELAFSPLLTCDLLNTNKTMEYKITKFIDDQRQENSQICSIMYDLI